MKNRKQKLVGIVTTVLAILIMSLNCYGHSGRTDANGGHKDNQNKSGLGSYHYHCGGYQAHLHPNGVCPYKNTTQTKNKSKQMTKKTTKQSATQFEKQAVTDSIETKKEVKQEKPTVVEVEQINLKYNNTEVKIGETISVIGKIIPENATNQKIKWDSSDETVATVNTFGKIEGKKVGTAIITATTENNKKAEMEVIVKEKTKNIANIKKRKKHYIWPIIGGVVVIMGTFFVFKKIIK